MQLKAGQPFRYPTEREWVDSYARRARYLSNRFLQRALEELDKGWDVASRSAELRAKALAYEDALFRRAALGIEGPEA